MCIRDSSRSKLDIDYNYKEISTTFIDIGDALLEEEPAIKETRKIRCPELMPKRNTSCCIN